VYIYIYLATFLLVTLHVDEFDSLEPKRSQTHGHLKAWVCGRSPVETVGSNATGCMDVCLVSVVCCQVEVYESG
jgi:hypothetical protein